MAVLRLKIAIFVSPHPPWLASLWFQSLSQLPPLSNHGTFLLRPDPSVAFIFPQTGYIWGGGYLTTETTIVWLVLLKVWLDYEWASARTQFGLEGLTAAFLQEKFHHKNVRKALVGEAKGPYRPAPCFPWWPTRRLWEAHKLIYLLPLLHCNWYSSEAFCFWTWR